MIDEVAKISSTPTSDATRKEWSTSIGSEPDRAWVAERQDQITADFQRLNEELAQERQDAAADDGTSDGDQRRHHGSHNRPRSGSDTEDAQSEARLSGESLCIGEGNLEEDVPFGQHVGFV